MRKSNYDKKPATYIDGDIWSEWPSVLEQIKKAVFSNNEKEKNILVIECYQGVYHPELIRYLSSLNPAVFIDTRTLFKKTDEIASMTYPFVTDDQLYGYRTSLTYDDFFDKDKLESFRNDLTGNSGLIIIYGHGAAAVCPSYDILIYADMARWEIQQRFRRKEINGLGMENKDETPSKHYKRGYFVDWIVCDSLKKKILPHVDFWLDTHQKEQPRMITGDTFLSGLDRTVHQPFRVVPFFDPAPWGGQWMKEVCDLDKKESNYGWCFDCVPEENSLYLNVSGNLFEMPANNLVFYKTKELLGEPVEARFGQDFPIRFDLLDTMEGGNLSLQVHPTTQYIRDQFGIYYTQDESYYLLDADGEATVYLGLKTGIDPDEMIADLKESQSTGKTFNAEKYVNKWPAKKHDHYLIPGGTIHCSGSGSMVLEISSTPSIFTFKLWDWGRLGLDGLPRPINIGHGASVINWERQTDYVRKNLVNNVTIVAQGEGWIEECTGLHENEFIETRRHWFDRKVHHHTGKSVNVLNVIEGEELIVESPENTFEPFIVHYAETFIIPAGIGHYTIRPHGISEGIKCGTIKAYVRY
ncbi:MAG: class I mannose-6-phosphate isomerase [Tannerella sp.]|jgi:mannose-6-phosphate isomerase class I|nr:class I mannose-6-phosphate isomerase [Tannerella sp.]